MQPDRIPVDMILFNGNIYTVDSAFTICHAMAVADGKIVATGEATEILTKYAAKKTIDLLGKNVYPGFIDAHCHFLSYGIQRSYAQLYGTTSFDEVLDVVKQQDPTKTGGWILGRGWDQNDWEVKDFPDCKILDSLYPNTPVYLIRIDGHAALANTAALKLVGYTPHTEIAGGVIKTEGDKCTGLVMDNAMEPFNAILPIKEESFRRNALERAQADCFAVGLTSVQDMGLQLDEIQLMQQMDVEGALQMRIYALAMAGDENFKWFQQHGKLETDRLHVAGFKYYADGALGSRGAALKEAYSDDPENTGLLFYTPDSLLREAQKIRSIGFQMCTHAIGDAANAEVLNVYAAVLPEDNDARWRVEHCQVVDPKDINLFGKYHIIPSVQPTHATSDMYWAKDRLGDRRVRTAYAYDDLLRQNGMVADGSDFPVESINPLYGFYAAVARMDQSGWPEHGWQINNALNREQALRAMTIWAAYAAFEEDQKGTLEPGKWADFVVTDKDIMLAPLMDIPATSILFTYVNGVMVYVKK
ncbi:MAG: amidohydrolase [Chitinophagales bacterium]